MSGRALVGTIIIVVGALMLLDLILPVNVWRGLFPVLIIAVGVLILLPVVRSRRRGRGRWWGGGTADDENLVNATSILGGVSERSLSKDFLGGRLTAFMGGVVVDLRDASVIEKPARIDVSAIMGGVEIYVPEHWYVKTDVTPIMGGVDEEREDIPRPEVDDDDPLSKLPDLHVKGTVLMGGVVIKG